jgi:hypothetical protein
MSRTVLNLLIVVAIMSYITITAFAVLGNLKEYSNAKLAFEGSKIIILIVFGLNTKKITRIIFKIAGETPKKGVSR